MTKPRTSSSERKQSRPVSPSAYAADSFGVDPRILYTFQGFIFTSGLANTRISDARRLHGVELPMVCVGRRKYIRGSDGIAFIEQLAELGAKKKRQPASVAS